MHGEMPVHDEMPVVIKIVAQLLYDNNLPINNCIFLCRHGCYSRLLVISPVTSVKLQIANYFWLTANSIMVLEISCTIGLAVSQNILPFAISHL